MNDRFNSVQYDMVNPPNYFPMLGLQEPNLSMNNNTSSSMQMPMNNSNYGIDNLSSTMQGVSLNNYNMEYMNNSRFLDMYNSAASNKYTGTNTGVGSSNNRQRLQAMSSGEHQQQRSAMSGNSTGRFPQFSNGPQKLTMHQMMTPSEHRIHTNMSGMTSIHPNQLNSHNNSGSGMIKSIPNSPSIIQKSLVSDPQRNIQGSTMFYSPSNIKELNQQQMENELEHPKWIVFPPVHKSAIDLRQGKQHMTIKHKDNPLFMNDDLRKIYLNRISSCLISAVNKNGAKIPDNVNCYIDITPIESTFEIRKSKTFARPSICYKAFNRNTEKFVLFRRFPGLVLASNYESRITNTFNKIHHPGIVTIEDAFLTDAFEDNSTIFIMDYVPCCATAVQTHISDVGKLIGFSSPFNVTQQARPYSSKKLSDLSTLPEDRSWCYLIQLVNVIRFVHNTLGMSCRLLDPSKIIIQYPNRIKLNCFGILDILSAEKNYSNSQFEPSNNLILQQTYDLKNLGQLMLSVICGTAASLQDNDFSVAVDLLQKRYSNNLKGIVLKLINNEFSSINDVAACTFAECYNHISLLYDHIDYLEHNLMKELECGKLFRLVCKLGTICERNELGMDNNWSDYGPNYQLKLFRDFVFHQVDDSGAPYLDLAHIVTSLNKLDSGSIDSVCLISRDRRNMFCTTFAELKKVLDDSFEQLVLASEKNHEGVPSSGP